jgi:cytochrome c-type biogenesis protein CcmH/NrfF
MGDDAIVDDFIKREGKRALAVPPAEGFNLLSWTMPFIAIGLGVWAIWAFIVRSRKIAVADAPGRVDRAALDRYQEQIDKDLAKLE